MCTKKLDKCNCLNKWNSTSTFKVEVESGTLTTIFNVYYRMYSGVMVLMLNCTV